MHWDEIKETWPDFDREKNHYLILAHPDFIVYLDESIDVDWETRPAYEKELPDPAKHNQVLNKVAELETIPNSHLDESTRRNFKRMIGEGLARSLQFDCENALLILREAETYIGDRNKEISRYWYLLSTGVTAGIAGGAGLIAWLCRGTLMDALGSGAFFIGIAGVAGGLGALLSVILRVGQSNLDGAAGKKLHYLEGFFRIVCGTISAILVALAIKAGIVLSLLSHIDNAQIGLVLAGLIAGASERLAPSLITGAENGHPTTDRVAQPPGEETGSKEE